MPDTAKRSRPAGDSDRRQLKEKANALRQRIAQRLRQRREEQGLTQAQLAERIGVPRVYVAGWEGGSRAISWESLVQVAEGLEVSPYDLMVDVGDVLRGQGLEPLDAGEMLRMPVAGEVTAGKPFTADVELQQSLKDYLHLRHPLTAVVKGDSLEPVASMGDVIILEPIDRPPIGELVVALVEDGVVAKRLEKRGKEYYLAALSGGADFPASQALIPWRIAYVIREPNA